MNFLILIAVSPWQRALLISFCLLLHEDFIALVVHRAVQGLTSLQLPFFQIS